MNAYENKEPVMIFFPVRIFSSSPKLNFQMNTPVPTATAAAGVANFISQSSILEKASLSFETNFGVLANEKDGRTISIIKINNKSFI